LPFSWHQPKPPLPLNRPLPAGYILPMVNNAKDMVSYVDGHVKYIEMYWRSSPDKNGAYSAAHWYNPPAGYDYQWSGD
jgi:hypothetical protein